MVDVVIVVEVMLTVEVVEVMVVVLWCHLLLHLLAGLQALVPSQQPQLVQLVALHLAGQEEVEGEGQVLSVPGARHLHIVLWLHPEGVDLNTHTQSEGWSRNRAAAWRPLVVTGAGVSPVQASASPP